MKKISIVLATLIITSKLSACCGCAIVIASTTLLKTTTKASIEAADASLSSYFEETIKKNTEGSLIATKSTEEAMSSSLKLTEETYLLYDKILFNTYKTNSVATTKRN